MHTQTLKILFNRACIPVYEYIFIYELIFIYEYFWWYNLCHVRKISSVLLLKHSYQKYPLCCLTGDRTLLAVSSHQSWRGGERERSGGMLYSSFCFCHLCLFGLSLTPRWKDDCPESFTHQSPRRKQPLWPHPHHIRDSALWSQWRNWVWKIQKRPKDGYRGG